MKLQPESLFCSIKASIYKQPEEWWVLVVLLVNPFPNYCLPKQTSFCHSPQSSKLFGVYPGTFSTFPASFLTLVLPNKAALGCRLSTEPHFIQARNTLILQWRWKIQQSCTKGTNSCHLPTFPLLSPWLKSWGILIQPAGVDLEQVN